MAVIKRERVQVDERRAEPLAPSPKATDHEKSARLLRLEGRVVGIEFNCTCGERSLIEIDCDDAAAVEHQERPE